MEDNNSLEFIESEIQKRIKSFDERRKFYREKTKQLTIVAASMSATTTFLIGLSQAYTSKVISVIALATSAGMTVLTALDNLYNYKRNWIQNNDTLMKLYELNSDIKYLKTRHGNDLTLEQIDEFYRKYQDILRSTNENWKESRSVDKKD
jgi:aspartokinase